MGFRVKVNNSTWKEPKSCTINVGSDGMKVSPRIYSKSSDNEWKIIWERYKKSLKYYGKATNLSQARFAATSANVGDYLLIAGGKTGSSEPYTQYSNVDIYNSSLTRSVTNLDGKTDYESNYGGGSIGDYALFAGGTRNSVGALSTVVTFNKSLTKSTASNLSVARNKATGANVGNYLLYGGGYDYNAAAVNTVDAYNKSLTKSTPTTLSYKAHYVAGGSVGEYALYAGGHNGSTRYTTANAYNASLTRSIPTALSTGRSYHKAARAGDYLVFAGGYNGSRLAVVDVYNSSLTRSVATSLPSGRNCMGNASVGEYAIFAGGIDTSLTVINSVVIYDGSLTRTESTLSANSSWPAGGSVGRYAIFAGGTGQNDALVNSVDVFELI